MQAVTQAIAYMLRGRHTRKLMRAKKLHRNTCAFGTSRHGVGNVQRCDHERWPRWAPFAGCGPHDIAGPPGRMTSHALTRTQLHTHTLFVQLQLLRIAVVVFHLAVRDECSSLTGNDQQFVYQVLSGGWVVASHGR